MLIRIIQRVTLLAIALSLMVVSSTRAQDNTQSQGGSFIAMGGSYVDVFPGFIETAIANEMNGQVNILVLPIAYASNSALISPAERQMRMAAAEKRRVQIHNACQSVIAEGHLCHTFLAPILTRADAQDPAMLAYFTANLSAVFILDGLPQVAMEVIAGTLVEQALERAYLAGAILAGTGAGAVIQSRAMLIGYAPNFTYQSALRYGATYVGNNTELHGLNFGIPGAVIDQSFSQNGNLSRLLSGIIMPGLPHLGIGVDSYTGVHVRDDGLLENVFGLYEVTILDAETYQSAATARDYGSDHVLSLRNVLVHLLAPGGSTYNLETRQHSLGAPSEHLDRTFKQLTLPLGVGALILSGNLTNPSTRELVMARFMSLSGGSMSRVLAITISNQPAPITRRITREYLHVFDAQVTTIVLSERVRSIQPPHPKNYDAIFFLADDQALLEQKINQLDFLLRAWLSGKPLLAGGSAAAALGAYFSAHGPTPQNPIEREAATQGSFLSGNTAISPGLSGIAGMVEPNLISDNRWGRLFSLAFNHPDLIAIGMADNTAVEFTQAGAKSMGENAVVLLDLRSANLDIGANNGFIIANGLLDIFAPGESLEARPADKTTNPPVVLYDHPRSSPTSVRELVHAPIPTPSASLNQIEILPAPGYTKLRQNDDSPYPFPYSYPYPTYPLGNETHSLNLQIIFGAIVIVLIVVFGWLLTARRPRF